MTHKHGFQLQQVLNYRKEVEKVKKLEFATARHEFEHASDVLSRHEAEADRARVEYNNKQAAGTTANELKLYADFFARKHMDIQFQRIEVDNLNRKMSEKREDLMDAAKEKKALELLKEKQMRAFRREMAERERAFLDEMALQKVAR